MTDLQVFLGKLFLFPHQIIHHLKNIYFYLKFENCHYSKVMKFYPQNKEIKTNNPQNIAGYAEIVIFIQINN
mgnify:CR=1 FL=1